jgi:hypothetical protein
MIASKRARRSEEHAAISGALALLTNLVMAWNTHRLQAAWDAIEPGQRDPLPSILIHTAAEFATYNVAHG